MGNIPVLHMLTKHISSTALMVIVIFLIGAVSLDGYTSAFSLRAILVLTAFLVIASAGQNITMLIGGIDLSIPFVIGFANVTVAQLGANGIPFVWAFIFAVIISVVLGIFNGGISAILNIHPLIVTLGSGTALLGSVLLWTKGYPSGSAPQYISDFVSIGASIGPIPVPWLLPFVIALVAVIVYIENRTVIGKQIYALGANPTAAPYVFIRPLKIWMLCFGVSAGLSALTGVLLLGFSGSAFADAGKVYLFQTVAAAVIGGTAISGGKGSILGTVAGCLVLIQLNIVLVGFGLSQSAVQVALGAVIVLVVAIYGRSPHIRTLI